MRFTPYFILLTSTYIYFAFGNNDFTYNCKTPILYILSLTILPSFSIQISEGNSQGVEWTRYFRPKQKNFIVCRSTDVTAWLKLSTFTILSLSKMAGKNDLQNFR